MSLVPIDEPVALGPVPVLPVVPVPVAPVVPIVLGCEPVVPAAGRSVPVPVAPDWGLVVPGCVVVVLGWVVVLG